MIRKSCTHAHTQADKIQTETITVLQPNLLGNTKLIISSVCVCVCVYLGPLFPHHNGSS